MDINTLKPGLHMLMQRAGSEAQRVIVVAIAKHTDIVHVTLEDTGRARYVKPNALRPYLSGPESYEDNEGNEVGHGPAHAPPVP